MLADDTISSGIIVWPWFGDRFLFFINMTPYLVSPVDLLLHHFIAGTFTDHKSVSAKFIKTAAVIAAVTAGDGSFAPMNRQEQTVFNLDYLPPEIAAEYPINRAINRSLSATVPVNKGLKHPSIGLMVFLNQCFKSIPLRFIRVLRMSAEQCFTDLSAM
jgi:hypothetical protein